MVAGAGLRVAEFPNASLTRTVFAASWREKSPSTACTRSRRWQKAL
jgi:hypothetical protein